MNVAQIVPSDPLSAMTRNLGQDITDARMLVDRLEAKLKHVDEKRERLREAGVTVDVDLGEIGNAAAAARRQMKTGAVTPTFELPRVKAG